MLVFQMANRYAGNKGLEYYKAYPRDFFEGTIGMAGQLRGFYRMVIDLVYMHDGFLLNDWGHISGHTGFGKTQCKRMMQQLVESGKIQVSGENGEFFTQKRAKSELKNSRKFQEKQSNKGHKRWKNKDLQDAVALPGDMPETCHHKTTRPQDLFSTKIDGKKSENKKSERQQILDILGKYASHVAALSFMEYRSKIKKPITVTAAKRVSSQLEKVLSRGGDPDDAISMCEERGWRAVNAKWYFTAKGQENEQCNNNGWQYPNSGDPKRRKNGASGAHAGLIAGLAYNAERYARNEGSDDKDDQIPL